jgi:hypothetical protein
MPLVRGRILPEVERAGRAKQFLDILIWAELGPNDLLALDELDHLRIYLHSLRPFVCLLRFFIPRSHVQTGTTLDELGIEYHLVAERTTETAISAELREADPDLLIAVGTALSVDADCLVINRREWYPFIEQIDRHGLLLTDCSFLLTYAELFLRGHDVPWSFRYKSWYAPWTAFYTLSEEQTFKTGIDLLHHAHKKKANMDAQETGRILVHNRIPNLCFTRDRLLFYEIQRLASKRAGWQRQQFTFEIAYSLNFYYMLIYGAFDHAALFVNQLLQLGFAPKQVGATYKPFLNALQNKSPAIYSIFNDPQNRAFIDRIGYLRHFAAHRGTLMPCMVVEALDNEPTNDELDEDIREAGLDYLVERTPIGDAKENIREMLRGNARMTRYEKGKVLEGVVLVELGGKPGFIHPHLDTPWNFTQLMKFLNALFKESLQLLA